MDFVISLILLSVSPFTNCQTILGDSCKHEQNVDNDVLMALRKLQMEFAAYRIDTQRELHTLKNRLGVMETELEEITFTDKNSKALQNTTKG